MSIRVINGIKMARARSFMYSQLKLKARNGCQSQYRSMDRSMDDNCQKEMENQLSKNVLHTFCPHTYSSLAIKKDKLTLPHLHGA